MSPEEFDQCLEQIEGSKRVGEAVVFPETLKVAIHLGVEGVARDLDQVTSIQREGTVLRVTSARDTTVLVTTLRAFIGISARTQKNDSGRKAGFA